MIPGRDPDRLATLGQQRRRSDSEAFRQVVVVAIAYGAAVLATVLLGVAVLEVFMEISGGDAKPN